MSSNPLPLLGEAPRKSVAKPSEGHRKPVAEDLKRAIGFAIARALELANLTKQEAAFQMGYEDQSALSRWISGVETAQFAKLFGIARLRGPLVIALAELSEDVVVETTISIRRSA